MNQLYFRSLLAFLAILVFVSCGGNKKSEKETSQDDILKANQIIIYTNKVIEESNHIHRWSEGNERNVMKLAELASKPSLMKDPFNITFFLSNSLFSYIDLRSNNNQIVDLRVVPNALDSDDKEFFEASAVVYHDSKDGLRDMYKKVEKYIQEENFKDDKGALGKAYSDSVKAYYMTMMIAVSEMSEAAVELGQEAEILTLGDSPLKEVILVMREQMKLSSTLIASFKDYQEGAAKKEDVLKLHEEYVAAYEKMISKEKDFKLSENQRRYFDRFLTTSETLKGYFKVGSRDLRDENKIKNTTISSCEIYNTALIQDYNEVVS